MPLTLDADTIITDAVRKEINAAARAFQPTVLEIKELAAACKVSRGTMNRYFGDKVEERNLLPRSANGTTLSDCKRTLGRALALRLAAGVALSGNVTHESNLTGETKQRTEAFTTLLDVSDKLLDVFAGKRSDENFWLAGAYRDIEVSGSASTGYTMFQAYAAYGYDEGYDDLYEDDANDTDADDFEDDYGDPDNDEIPDEEESGE